MTGIMHKSDNDMSVEIIVMTMWIIMLRVMLKELIMLTKMITLIK